MNRNMRYPGFKKKALTLSYDDGVEQDIRLIEIMTKYGLKGTFNINTELFVPEGTVFPVGQVHRRMSEKQAYELYMSNGMEIAVHTCQHPHLEAIPTNECAYEVLQDKTNIERATGKLCRGMAYPFGTTNDQVVEVLKSCGILYSRTTVATKSFKLPEDWLRLPATCHHNEPQLMELAKQFVERKFNGSPIMFYLWGHSYEFESDNNWHVIEEFAKYMGGREEIWYATNIEIFEYIEAYKQLRTSNDGKMVYNPTCTTLYFNIGQQDYEIKAGETIIIA